MQKPAGLDCCFAEYLLNLQDEVIHSFVTDHRIKAAGVKTNCNIELTKRILNRKVNGFKWVKYSILRITGPDETSIGQCNKIIERVYPPYKYRKEYFRRAPVVLYTGDVCPDNTALYFNRQRTGRTVPVCGEMRVESPFEIGRPRNPDKVPWKGSKLEEAGVYYPSSYGNENLFRFYNLGKINSKPLHYNKEGVFNPQLVGPYIKRGITPVCNRDFQAAGVSKHLMNMAFGKIGQMPPEMDSGHPDSGDQQPPHTSAMATTYGESMQVIEDSPCFIPETSLHHFSDVSQNSNQSGSGGKSDEFREESFMNDANKYKLDSSNYKINATDDEGEDADQAEVEEHYQHAAINESPEIDQVASASQMSEKHTSQRSSRDKSGTEKLRHSSSKENPPDHLVLSDPVLSERRSSQESKTLTKQVLSERLVISESKALKTDRVSEGKAQNNYRSAASSSRSARITSERSRSEAKAGTSSAPKLVTYEDKVVPSTGNKTSSLHSQQNVIPVVAEKSYSAPSHKTSSVHNNQYNKPQTLGSQPKQTVIPVVPVVSDYVSEPTVSQPTNNRQQNVLDEVIKDVIPKGYYGDMIIKDRLPLGHNDPVIIMVDGQDIIMTGNTAMAMTGNEHGKFVMNLGTEDYNISISGDRDRLRYLKGGTKGQNQNMGPGFNDTSFQPHLNQVQVIV